MDLLDTIDTLTTSLESCPPLPPLQTSDPNQKEDILITEHRNLHEGLGMVENILMRALERNGLTAIPTEGEPMPGFHEIVREVEGEENDVGMIANVLKRGYSLNGKVLRPAKVLIRCQRKINCRSSCSERGRALRRRQCSRRHLINHVRTKNQKHRLELYKS